MVADLKPILSLEAIEGQRLTQKKNFGEKRAEREQKLVGFDNQCFRNGADTPQDPSPKGNATRAQKTFPKPEDVSGSHRIDTKLGRFADQFAPLGAPL